MVVARSVEVLAAVPVLHGPDPLGAGFVVEEQLYVERRMICYEDRPVIHVEELLGRHAETCCDSGEDAISRDPSTESSREAAFVHLDDVRVVLVADPKPRQTSRDAVLERRRTGHAASYHQQLRCATRLISCRVYYDLLKVGMSRDKSISARCSELERSRYHKLAARLGYTDFSEFLRTVLDQLDGAYGDHECRLLHVSDDRIVGSGPRRSSKLSGPASAFEVVASERFWAHVDRHTGE